MRTGRGVAHADLLPWLCAHGRRFTTADVADELGCSDRTARRAVERLAAEGLVIRVAPWSGGGISPSPAVYRSAIQWRDR